MDRSPNTDVPPGATGPASRLGPDVDEHPADALRAISSQIAELKEYVTYFISAKVDGIKASVRNVGLYAGLALVGAIVGAGLLVTAAALLLIGLAGAIGAIFDPDLRWLGDLVVGVVVLGGTVGGALWFIKRMKRTSKQQTIHKYQSRQDQQRMQYGHDVSGRARESAGSHDAQQ
jgi:hypothetical protein